MLKISKLTITSIFPGYSDLVTAKNPAPERAVTLMKERLIAKEGFLVQKAVPEYEQKTLKLHSTKSKGDTKTFIG